MANNIISVKKNIKIKSLNKDILQYALGALMYTPAINKNIAKKILEKKFIGLRSLALCLEDSINDISVLDAENQLIKTLTQIQDFICSGMLSSDEIPLLFIRIRNVNQMIRLYNSLGKLLELITGFILPKFDLSNAQGYVDAIKTINKSRERKLFIMPILESSGIISIDTRAKNMKLLKNILDNAKEYILNVRVGGNDFCNLFGIRRKITQTIYDIGVIQTLLSDIVNIFSHDYVVSAPVWEYFYNTNSDQWLHGLNKELELDLLNGFIGKTAIHPSQVIPINESLKVDEYDFKDAKNILNWDDKTLAVSKSSSSERMNEAKVHINWAKKTMILASLYGIK